MLKREFVVLCSMLSCVSSFAQDAVDVDKIPFDKIEKAKIEVVGLRNASSQARIRIGDGGGGSIQFTHSDWDQKREMSNLYVLCNLEFKSSLSYMDSFIIDGSPRTADDDGVERKDRFGVPQFIIYELKRVNPMPSEDGGRHTLYCEASKGISKGSYRNVLPTLGEVKKAIGAVLKITLEQESK